MKHLKITFAAMLLTVSLLSIPAYAGTITGSAARTGTITGSRTGTITGSRTGTITGSRVGTITGSATTSMPASDQENNASNRNGFLTRVMMYLLLLGF